jgi:hypothetical protein
MDHATKLHRLADMLAHGHGGTAPLVALERARECREDRDYESALMWLEVALLVGRDAPDCSDAKVSGGAAHDGLVTLLRRRWQHKP